ncbi:Zn(II)2Cys6 transcription factor domain-containing protein [Aspergillus lucknowensis]|uniref:Zn(2)-C6 fungal-type domain-containing protein n=1 Tax=Aspergillus lucknowensis TaxID=176173 RepID=A0ABR4LKZ9_9EURO
MMRGCLPRNNASVAVSPSSPDNRLLQMETPPKARGPGRSGPRRRTGCLTCRARKVRCDEVKPTCANCTRLRLQCAYGSMIISGMTSNATSSRARSTSSTTQEAEEASPSTNLGGGTFVRADEQQSQSGQLHGLSQPLQQHQHQQQQQQQQQHALNPGESAPDFSIPFDMLGFIGEITSDFQQKHLDLTNGGIVAPSPTAVADIDGGLFQDERQMAWGPGGMGDVGILTQPDPHSPRRSNGGKEAWEEQLLEYFRESEPPPTIFGPVDLEWKHVRDIMLAQSGGCRALALAIYCYSDIHKAWVEGTRWKFGPTYHAQASEDIQSCLIGEVGESVLKRMFTSVFLLMLAELIAPDGWRPATSYLHTSYLLLQRFQHRTTTWTGFAHLITSWISLLDVKALVAGRDGDALAELGNLNPKPTPPKDQPSKAISSTLDQGKEDNEENGEDEEEDPLLKNPTYLITHSITSPAFTFLLATQQLTRRIVIIDLHHRTRGTVADEFEVLQIAHAVSADLESLWNSRPPILDLYSSTSASEAQLTGLLSPQLIVAIVRTFRTYVANFLALFVYLHRVAFAIYPRTDRVYRAVDQIILLAKEESSRGDTGTGAGTGSVPVGFVWPLFIAALEGSMEQRQWIVGEMQRMASFPAGLGTGTGAEGGGVGGWGRGGASRHPNAGKALVLLEEMTRRQDASRTWADSKCVRRELFTDFFVMI